VWVENYDGPGSGLGNSMLAARQRLQCPFVFHCCDTLIGNGNIPSPVDADWLAGAQYDNSANYRTMVVGGGYVVRFMEKGEGAYDAAYIGVAGIRRYATFWKTLAGLPGESSDVHAYQAMGGEFKYVVQGWHDIGNMDGLREARRAYPNSPTAMEKYAENTYFVGDTVIKFYADDQISHNRVRRANEELGDVVPTVTGERECFYRYPYAAGVPLSKTATPERLRDLLTWAHTNLWRERVAPNRKAACMRFYRDKTLDRLKQIGCPCRW